MASLFQDAHSGRYRIRFRYGGQPYNRSLTTSDRQEAETVRSRVEETLRLLTRGRLEIPADADPGTFVLTDGKRNGKPSPSVVHSLNDLFKVYQEKLPAGTKEATTLQGEARHIKHLLRHIGANRIAQTIKGNDIQRYVEKRLQESWHGKPIRPDTIKKELTTFRLIWNWAVNQGYLKGIAPMKGIKFPKRDQKPPFMTHDEIQRTIVRGGLPMEKQNELWECLFLNRAEVQDVLDDVKKTARRSFVYPMFVFAAHTGARRSEILRSQIDDFDFHSRTVLIREKKKSRTKAITYRRVPMTSLFCDVMRAWFDNHPGGQFTICDGSHTTYPMSPFAAHDHFKRTLRGSKWEKIRGFHTFRHSFASNLAAASVDQRIIDEWMGHQTEEMRKRYRHLFPDQQRAAIDSVFGRNGK